MAACGSVSPELSGDEDLNVSSRGFFTNTIFTNRCTRGFLGPSKTIKLELMATSDLPGIRAENPVPGLKFSADCRKKWLNVQSDDRLTDKSWELMPDGSFNMIVDIKGKL